MRHRINAVVLAPTETPARLQPVRQGVHEPGAQRRVRAAMERGFQTREAEMALGRTLGDLTQSAASGIGRGALTDGWIVDNQWVK